MCSALCVMSQFAPVFRRSHRTGWCSGNAYILEVPVSRLGYSDWGFSWFFCSLSRKRSGHYLEI